MSASRPGDVSRQSSSSDVLPRWARVFDAVCVALFVLAAIVSVSGGFRERFGDVRFALTSPWRIAAVGVLLGALRHWRVPSPAAWADLPSRLLTWIRSDAVAVAGRAFAGTRPVILFVGLMAVVMFGYKDNRPPMRFSENEVINLQVRWDMGWYFGIAVDGYHVEIGRAHV